MEKLHDVKAVIFDLDGTLIDTEKYYRICWPKALAHLKQMFDDPELDYPAIRAYRKELMEEALARDGIRIKPGAVELLTFLRERGIITAIATATDMERATRYLKKIGLETYFDRIISATMVKEGKPSPDIYIYACEQLGLQPEKCLAVEDSPNGITSAYHAGCRVIMVPDQTEPEEELKALLSARVDTLSDLIGLIGK